MDVPQLFTRGGLDAPDNRGKSMVEKHLEMRRQELEETCMALLRKKYPKITDETRKVVLEESEWDAESACMKLDEFLKTTGKDGGSRKRRQGNDAGDSGVSGSDSSSDGSSSSDSGAAREKDKKKKKKKSKKESKEKDKKKKDKDGKDKKSSKGKKKKKSKSDERDKSKASRVAEEEAQFGKYGILKESDMWEKRPEFSAWLAEVKGVSLESLPKWEERDLFKSFIEDYNTATLPHVKYYDLTVHHKREEAKAAAEGRATAPVERTDFTNMEDERKKDFAVHRLRKAEEDKKSLIQHMLLTGKLEGLREQQHLQAELQMAAAVGDNKRVAQIQARLAPDDPRDSLAMHNYGFRPS